LPVPQSPRKISPFRVRWFGCAIAPIFSEKPPRLFPVAAKASKLENFAARQRKVPKENDLIKISQSLTPSALQPEEPGQNRSNDHDEARELHAAAIRLFKSGRIEQSRQLMLQALRCEESSVRWNDFATIAIADSDFKAAEQGYRRAVELDPTNKQAAANLAYYLANPSKFAVTTESQHASQVTKFLATRSTNDIIAEQFSDGTVLGRIRALPSIDSIAPNFLREAIRRGLPYTGYFVRGALKIIGELPQAEQNALLPDIQRLARIDRRFKVLSGVLCMMRSNYLAAQRWLESAIAEKPEDIFASDALVECLSLSPENRDENIAARSLQAYLAAHTCAQPWNHLELLGNKNAYLCCPTWLPLSVGRVEASSADEMWHSEAAAAIRASILNGSFRFCNKAKCAAIVSRTLSPKSEEANFIPAAKLKDAPRVVSLAYDFSCNLACPQCRCSFQSASLEQQQQMDNLFVPWVEDAVTRADVLYLNGEGDVFGSKHSRALLGRMTRDHYPNLKFQIITNGQLFDERAYRELDLAGRIQSVKISIDAATSETYEIVRRGGSFSRLLRNLEFLDGLRVSSRDSFRLELLFVVSIHNFREMPAFVKLAKSFHADLVLFTSVNASSSLSAVEIKHWTVFHPDHPQHAEFLHVIQSPELRDPIVSSNLPVMANARPEAAEPSRVR
jgi:tetratricopeptide (TPR) repeat protein